MRIATLLALAACSILGASRVDAAPAKEVEAKSTIVSVVVHPDAATITREAAVTLPAGASTVLFTGVTYALVPDSLRAGGEAESDFTIGAVEARVQPAQSKPADAPVAARLNELRAARATLEVNLEALRAKLAMIKRFSETSPEKIGSEAKPLAVSEWGMAFETIGAAHAKTGEELRLATAKAQELDGEIAGLAGAGGGAKSGLTRDIAVGVESRAGGHAKILLTYRTDAASWRPAYSARLDTGEKDAKPTLKVQSRAVVTQHTGEEWRDVTLSVSTLRARRGAAAPEVAPRRVAFFEPALAPAPMPMPSAAMARAKSAPAGGAGEPAALDNLAANAAKKVATDAVADLDASGYAATFKIAGASSAPGDGSAKTFLLSTRRLEPKLAIRTAPGLDPQAYLAAHIVNEDEAPLLPGVVTVERDGVLVGSQSLALVAPGDATDFGFGVDDKVKVARVPIKRKENEPAWFGQTKTDAREFKTSVKNLHDFPVNVTVVDQAPFSENSAIVVEMLPQTTPPTEKQLDDKRGVMAWSFALAPGETKEIRLAYRLKWPADRDIVFESAPLAR